MVYVFYRHAKNLRHLSPQNKFTLKEFETTTWEIGLIIFLKMLDVFSLILVADTKINSCYDLVAPLKKDSRIISKIVIIIVIT